MHLQQHIAQFAAVLARPTWEEKKAFVKKIKPSSKISPQLALDIYKNNTRGSRVNALAAIYPACKNILGDEVFHSMAKTFVDADVFGTADLNNYGADFSSHLASIINAGRLTQAYHYLADLARLEFLFHAAYYADDDPVFDFALFENRIKKEQPVFFRLSESLAVLAFQTPIYEIWMNNYQQLDVSCNSVRATSKTQYLLIHRGENTPMVQVINDGEYQLLHAFVKHQSLQEVIDTIDCDVDVILPMLIANRWITGIK